MIRKRRVHGENAGGSYAYGQDEPDAPQRVVSGKIERADPNLKALSLSTLIDALTRSLNAHRHDAALERVTELIAREPGEARWHEKLGDVLLRLDRATDAAWAYRDAARLYEVQGMSGHPRALRQLADKLERSER